MRDRRAECRRSRGGGKGGGTSVTRFNPSRTSLSIREFNSFLVSCTVDAFDPGPSTSFRRPDAEADCAASRVRSRAVSSILDIRARDSIFGSRMALVSPRVKN